MNRSILIVICDFLLVSLLAFSTAQINQATDQGAAPTVKTDLATTQVDSGKDLAAVMRQALEQEQKNRDQLLGELASSREAASQREKQMQSIRQELQSREQSAQRMEEQFALAQTNIQALNQRLVASSTAVSASEVKLAALEAELDKRAHDAAALQQQLSRLESTNQAAQSEKQRLATALQVAQAENRSATEQVSRMREEVKIEREEKARLTQQAEKLAEGVKALASNSGQLAAEIRDNRALAPNTIFNEFVSNRVQAVFAASRTGLFGFDSTKRRDTETVLVSDGTNTFAMCHVDDTPLSFWPNGTEWEGLSGTLGRDNTTVPIGSLSFHFQDPRIVLVPVTAAQVRQLGCKIYRISADPFKFQDAVLVGAREGYYGECKFQIDLTTPEYVKLDRSVLKGLFGKFNPSRGDLVFSKSGELLGVMANSTYCLMIHNFDPVATFQFGKDVRAQHTGKTLSQLYTFLLDLPSKLQ